MSKDQEREKSGNDSDGVINTRIEIPMMLEYDSDRSVITLTGVVPLGPARQLDVCIAFELHTRWLTPRQGDAYAHLRHGSIKRAIENGELQSYQPQNGASTLVSARDIDRWIMRRQYFTPKKNG